MPVLEITCHARDCSRSGSDLVRGRTTCPEHYGQGVPVTRFKKNRPHCSNCEQWIDIYSGDCLNQCKKRGFAGTVEERRSA